MLLSDVSAKLRKGGNVELWVYQNSVGHSSAITSNQLVKLLRLSEQSIAY